MEETRAFLIVVWPAILSALGSLVGLAIMIGAAWIAFRLLRRMMELFERPASFKVLVDQWEEVVYGKLRPRPPGSQPSPEPAAQPGAHPGAHPVQEFLRTVAQYLSTQGVGRMTGIVLMFGLLLLLIYVTFDLIAVGTNVLMKFAGKG